MLTSFTFGELLHYYSFALLISVAKIGISNIATMTEEEVLSDLWRAVCQDRGLSYIEKCINENKFLSTKVDAMQKPSKAAISKNMLEAFKILLNRGLFSNSALSEFLDHCILYDRLVMVEYLIKKGVNVCRPFESGQTPLSYAIKCQNIKIVELLIDNGAKFTINSALLEAIKIGNSAIVELLLQKGALINFQTKEGSTPLIQVLDNDTVKLEIVEKLVKKGADVNLSTAKGTPLMVAINRGVPKIVDFLVRNKAEINLSTSKGTPLMVAVNKGVPEILDILVQNQADVNQCDENGHYPIMRAMDLRNNEIVKMLVKNNAKLDIKYKNGDTLFMKAVRLANREMIKYFLEHGEDVNQKDKNGLCALSVALSEDDFSTFDLLIQSGANPGLASTLIQAKADKNLEFALYMLEISKKRNEKGLTGQEAAK